ncbi:segregation/condensation protein A [Candidatus Woesearchaeota archaeon]|nr:segregation/condensation protein A [Candidatus Woesearchaeota archaeon]
MEDQIIGLVVGKDEVTWQSMLMDLVKREGMDPWDVNITLLTQKYIDMLKSLKELDFRVSGKMVLAAALLLRVKSARLVGEDMMELDRLMRPQEETDELGEGFYEELEQGQAKVALGDYPQLMPRTPQPRKRKVSIYDLVGALQKALEVSNRRILRRPPVASIRLPERKIDLTKLLSSVYARITEFFKKAKLVTFSQILPSDRQEDKILTFISLLYLSNHDQRKIDLVQKEPFGEIEIVLRESAAQIGLTESAVQAAQLGKENQGNR